MFDLIKAFLGKHQQLCWWLIPKWIVIRLGITDPVKFAAESWTENNMLMSGQILRPTG